MVIFYYPSFIYWLKYCYKEEFSLLNHYAEVHLYKKKQKNICLFPILYKFQNKKLIL